MSLWFFWWNAIRQLRPAFTRLQTFLWFVTTVAGLTVRTEHLGVTSIVRALNLDPRHYNSLVRHFASSAIKLDQLTALWTKLVFRLLPQALRVNDRYVLVGDGIKIPKYGNQATGDEARPDLACHWRRSEHWCPRRIGSFGGFHPPEPSQLCLSRFRKRVTHKLVRPVMDVAVNVDLQGRQRRNAMWSVAEI